MPMDKELLAALKLVRNMAYELQDQGHVLYDLVEDGATEEQNAAALEKQSDAIDIVDRFLIDAQSDRR